MVEQDLPPKAQLEVLKHILLSHLKARPVNSNPAADSSPDR